MPSGDVLNLDSQLTPEQIVLRDRVRGWVDAEVLPIAGACHDESVFPETWLRGLASLGVFDGFLHAAPDPVAYGIVARELERGGSPLRSVLSVQGALTMGAIAQFGSDEQRETWLAPLSQLDAIGCFSLTEPNFGSNPSGMETRAERTSTGFRITGHKRWATNGTIADIAVVWAKLDDKVAGFLIETDRPGFHAIPIKQKWSFRASESAELRLDGVEIPASAQLPHARSLGAALRCLNLARYGIAWGVVGAAQACLEETTDYLCARTQFAGKPIASHQLVQGKLAWMAADVAAMHLMAWRLAALKADDTLQPHQVSLVKMHNCRKALDVARGCRDLLGANGVTMEHHVGRRMVDLETVVTYEGTEHIHQLVVGQHLTGISAFE